MFEVTDLKQFAYCPRIVYYRYCWPAVRPVTEKMELGLQAGETEEVREARRSLRPYGLRRGVRHLDVYLASERWNLRGRVDLAIQTDDNASAAPEAIPVDFKLSPGRMGDNLRLQLAGYGVLLEETWGMACRRGFVYFIPRRRAVAVPFGEEMRVRLESTLAVIQAMVDHERMPAPVRERGRCQVCEFRLFCNDV